LGAISFIESTTSTGILNVIEVMGRSLTSRVRMRSGMFMVSPFFVGRLAGGNNPNGRVLNFNVHNEQQST
jgi:hypothetical protein